MNPHARIAFGFLLAGGIAAAGYSLSVGTGTAQSTALDRTASAFDQSSDAYPYIQAVGSVYRQLGGFTASAAGDYVPLAIDEFGGMRTAVSVIDNGSTIYKFLTRTSGPAGADATDMVTVSGFCGGTPDCSIFDYTCAVGARCFISRVNCLLQDANIKPDAFGGIGPLANGLFVQSTDSTPVANFSFTDTRSITTNAQFAYLAGSDIAPVPGTAIDALPIRWTLYKAGGGSRPYELGASERIRIIVQDDLTGINEFRCFVQGWSANAEPT